MIMTASWLFGARKDDGPNRCYYCGGPACADHAVSTYVKDTFTNRDIVICPASRYVCSGCAEAIGLGEDQWTMLDGSIKVRENDRGMAPRMYSWVLTAKERRAATKAHMAQLRDTILNPPDPPFAIILADSGQKQLIFRALVAFDRQFYPLLLEDERIDVAVPILRERLELATTLCAACGKPPLLDAAELQLARGCMDYYGSPDVAEQWLDIRVEPLSRLAAWLCPAKETSQHEYPSPLAGGVPPATRPVLGSGKDRDRPQPSRSASDQSLFDFG